MQTLLIVGIESNARVGQDWVWTRLRQWQWHWHWPSHRHSHKCIDTLTLAVESELQICFVFCK